MHFDNFSDFIAMGGHAAYVWPCYLITLVVMVLNVILPARAKKRFLVEQARQFRRESGMNNEVNNAPGS